MNKTVKNKWIAALNSGKYKQGKNRLRYGNQNGTFHCCLGVLSELAVKEGACSSREAFNDTVLTKEVIEWAGLPSEDPCLKSLYNGLCEVSCSFANDKQNKSFKEIAAAIKKDL